MLISAGLLLVSSAHARIQKVLSEGFQLKQVLFLQLMSTMRGSKYYDKRVIISPPPKRHYMAFRWRVDDGPTLNAGLVPL